MKAETEFSIKVRDVPQKLIEGESGTWDHIVLANYRVTVLALHGKGVEEIPIISKAALGDTRAEVR